MSVAFQEPMTLLEFLAWEERQELRWEFNGFEPVAMTGGTIGHETIGGTLRALLYNQLNGKPCSVRGPALKIEVAGRIRYPDAFVSCRPVPRGATVIKDPVVVFEVLSPGTSHPGTSHTDRIEKLREYQATPSIQRYVILEQDSVAATVFARRDEDWIARPLIAGDRLEMPEIDVVLLLTDIYADIDMDAPELDEFRSTALE